MLHASSIFSAFAAEILFFGARSLHLADNAGSADNLAVDAAEFLLVLD